MAQVTEPRIQYVKSADGARIACWATGGGKPLVFRGALQWASSAFFLLPESDRWSEGSPLAFSKRSLVASHSKQDGAALKVRSRG